MVFFWFFSIFMYQHILKCKNMHWVNRRFFFIYFEKRSTIVVDFHKDKVALGVTLKVKILILH